MPPQLKQTVLTSPASLCRAVTSHGGGVTPRLVGSILKRPVLDLGRQQSRHTRRVSFDTLASDLAINSHTPQAHVASELTPRALSSSTLRPQVHHRVYPEHSFIPDFPVRGSGDWSSGSSGDAGSRPTSGLLEGASAEQEVGEAQKIQDAVDPEFPQQQQQQSSDAYPLAPASTSVEASSATDTLPVPVEESDVEGRRQVLLRRQESASQRNSTIRRRSTLRSFQVKAMFVF